jgi:hypothetical protein
MFKKWTNPTSGDLWERIRVIEQFIEYIRKEFDVIAEEHRTLGFLTEGVSQALTEMEKNQFPQTAAMTHSFVQSLIDVESVRKLLYHRFHLLSQNAFQSTVEQIGILRPRIKERDAAIGRYLKSQAAEAKATKPDPALDQRLSRDTSTYHSMNVQTIQTSVSFMTQMHRDLVTALSVFAHAQMEMHVKAIETWANAIEAIDAAELEEDCVAIADGMGKIVLTVPGMKQKEKQGGNSERND